MIKESPVFDPTQETVTIPEAIGWFAYYLDISREEAGRHLANKRTIGALVFFEKMPRGRNYLAHPDTDGFYSKETIARCFLDDKEPDGENLLSIAAKNFFYFIEDTIDRPLDFNPDLICSPSDFHQDMHNAESEVNILYQQERKASANLKARIKELEKENEALRHNNPAIFSNRTEYQNISTEMKIAWEAYQRFWKNADLNDPETCEIKQGIIDWIKEKGLSKTAAERIAEVIRPEGAPVGRRAD